MNRREFLKAAGVAVAAMTAPGMLRAQADKKRPNIIVMMADDFGYECLSCNGGSPYQTPNLDKLAAGTGGLRFSNGFAQPLCTPSRVKIMTGRYNFRNYTVFGKLLETEKTFGQVLKAAGYATCIVGKWQLGRDLKLPYHFGFDEYCLWWLTNRSDRYDSPGLIEQNGKKLTGLQGKYGPDVVSNFMLDFITRHKDGPFFCYYPMILTHSPYPKTPDSPAVAKKYAEGTNPNFVDMVAYTDKIVGRIVAHLEKLGLRENTVILFTGDNGTGKGMAATLDGKKMVGGKGTCNGHNGTHTPLIASYPAAGTKGKDIDDLVDFSDFMPTVAELAGARLPEGVTIDGVSFAPQLRGEKGNPRDWMYICYYGKGRSPKPAVFARSKQFLLYENGRMFDVVKDYRETTPLPADTTDPAAVAGRKQLQAVLDRYRTQREKLDATGMLQKASKAPAPDGAEKGGKGKDRGKRGKKPGETDRT